MSMATQKGVISKKKNTYLIGLKAITNWLFSKQRKPEELEYIISKFEIDSTIIKRFLLYTYGTPHITWFINKYINQLFQFNKFKVTDIIYSLTYLLDINRIVKKSIPEKFLYLKNTELADKNKQKIKALLQEYFSKLYDKEYTDQELNIFYDFILLNAITPDQITEIDKHINNNKTTIVLDYIDSGVSAKPINTEVLNINREFSNSIREFIEGAKKYILSRDVCKNCELFGKPTVILDTNVSDIGEVDILFLGLNPGIEEAEMGLPFVGKSGTILRNEMAKIPLNTKWVITNTVLCHTRNESEIKNFESVKENCKGLVHSILSSFPSKIIVPLGAKATSYFELKGGMSNLSGKIFSKQDQIIIPIIHPSSANYNPSNLSKFKSDFAVVLNQLKTKEKPTLNDSNITIPSKSNNLPISSDIQNNIITSISDGLTFLDVHELSDNKILKIFIDKAGKKKYLIEDYVMHFYIKNDNWKNYNQITDKIDGIVKITGREKFHLIKNIREKLNNIKNI
jgi:DNA polymerase